MAKKLDYSKLTEQQKNNLRDVYIVFFVGRKDRATGKIIFDRMNYKVSSSTNDLICDPENPHDRLISLKHKVYKRHYDKFGHHCTMYIEDTSTGHVDAIDLQYRPNVFDNAKDYEIKVTNNESIILRYGIFAMDPHNDEDVLKIASANGVEVKSFLDEDEKASIALEK